MEEGKNSGCMTERNDEVVWGLISKGSNIGTLFQWEEFDIGRFWVVLNVVLLFLRPARTLIQIHSSLVERKGVPTVSRPFLTDQARAKLQSCAAKPSASWTGGLVARPPSQPAPAVSFIYIYNWNTVYKRDRTRETRADWRSCRG